MYTIITNHYTFRSLSASTSSNDTSSNKITLNETSVDEEEATESAHDKFLKLQSVFGQSVTFKKVDNQPKRMIGLKSDSNTSEEDNQLEERKEDEQSDIPANENSPKSLENELTLHSDTSDEEINVEDDLFDEILSSN